MRWRFIPVLAAVGAAALFFTSQADESTRALTMKAQAAKFALEEGAKPEIGKLRHRGTLRLTSEDADFGGLSGLIVSEDGARFLAITDASRWLTGQLHYRHGRLTGLSGGEIAPLRATDGTALSGKAGDAEGLTGSLDGDVFVSFERDHRIWRYPFGKDGLNAKPSVVRTPSALKQAPDNGGLEGIGLLADGRILALTESYHDDSGNIRGWLLKGDEDAAVTLKRRAPFALTDVRELPGGDVLTLERRFNRIGGVGFAMRRIRGTDVAADALLDGEVVAEAGMNFVIDNMEGLSVRKGEDGETIVYIVSDNNFNSPLQQTLLMMFELRD
jgi:hypothetical protein